MYRIYGVQVANGSAVGNQLTFVTRHIEDDTATIDTPDDMFFIFDCIIDGAHATLNLNKPIVSKHIAVGGRGSSIMEVSYIIYYDLVKASVNDLVYEFVKRGKNP